MNINISYSFIFFSADQTRNYTCVERIITWVHVILYNYESFTEILVSSGISNPQFNWLLTEVIVSECDSNVINIALIDADTIEPLSADLKLPLKAR